MAAILLLATVGHVAGAPPASACQCPALGYSPDEEEAFAEAEAVFVGEVVDYSTRGSGDFSAQALWVFRVEQVYKGSVAERHGVVSSLSTPTCGLSVPKTGRVLVFASRPPEGFDSIDGADLFAHGCDPSRAIQSLRDLETLGNPVPPRPGVGGALTLEESGTSAWPILAAALTAAGVLALTWGVYRKRRSPDRRPIPR